MWGKYKFFGSRKLLQEKSVATDPNDEWLLTFRFVSLEDVYILLIILKSLHFHTGFTVH